VVGLVGGIGSGKSSLARHLARSRPAAVIDADSIGHEVLHECEVREQIARAFGRSVFDNQGVVDRKALGRLVFGDDPAARQARQTLETIVHPRIAARLAQRIAQAQGDPGAEAILLDAAVLLETGWRALCDKVVFVDVPLAERQRRVGLSRGWSPGELARRESSQKPLVEKRREADFVVDNSGSLDSAAEALAAIVFDEVDR
jgi:dephospho-CoA kinase